MGRAASKGSVFPLLFYGGHSGPRRDDAHERDICEITNKDETATELAALRPTPWVPPRVFMP